MLCPRCGSNQNDEIKFCTSCGANLQAVREVLDAPGSGKHLEWGSSWVTEMFKSGQIAELRKLEMERRLGVTPEIKRYNEIKAGVIVSSVGIAVMIFLFVFMQAIAGQSSNDTDAEVLRHVWISGVIPFMVGLALIINGLTVSKKIVQALEREQRKTKELDEGVTPRGLRAAETTEFIPANMSSVTDQTTRHLEHAERKVNR
jgi:DNA-binding transcriptional MerR regulator